ncbi:MAG: sulfatase-like hydrolase/transferase [Prevotella sp.]|nr:sulfatase-like hydrolase/transferase [Prevotella sp.]
MNRLTSRPIFAVVCNLLLAYVVYQIARVAYLLDNWSYFSQGLSWELWKGGLMFDTSAILITNSVYIVLMLLPLHWKENWAWWQKMCKVLFVTVNTVALALCLADAAYFPFTMRRTTTTVFNEFQNESNIWSIIATETLNHWYFVVLAVIVAYALWRLYRNGGHRKVLWWQYDLEMLISLAIIVPLAVAGIRGGFTTAVRPITISNASQYVDRPIDAALVLNTPFAIYRTIGKDVFTVPDYFSSEEEMAAVYSPEHKPLTTHPSPLTPKNVVVLIIESFGREYIGALNKDLENGNYKGYTPCVDSIIGLSTTFQWSYCNGRKSIDGMPSILSAIPMFVEPFFLTPASMNEVSGIASLLTKQGYETAFFHGAQRGSMGFQAFARKTGFQQYYGREDFEDDPRFGGHDDFDGLWAIWDEPFLQYYCAKMTEMQQPFMTAVFTATSHHPYKVPKKYADRFPEEGIEIHKCIRYTDMAIGHFFQEAARQPWFENTIFVLTSDHTNQSDHAYYQTDLGGFCSPIIIYEPSDTTRVKGEIQPKVAQQTDILPTVMGLTGCEEPFVAFGIDLLATKPEDTWAVNYLNGTYQYVKYGHVLQFDGTKTRAIYALSDSLMQTNLVGQVLQQQQMERELKAIIQQYITRMINDKLTIK